MCFDVQHTAFFLTNHHQFHSGRVVYSNWKKFENLRPIILSYTQTPALSTFHCS